MYLYIMISVLDIINIILNYLVFKILKMGILCQLENLVSLPFETKHLE